MALLEDGPNAPGAVFEPRVTQLRALVTIAREASYTRAARYLGYTESAVFLQVKALERLVGLPVVERRNNRIELTAAGEKVHKYALRIIGDVEAMGREIAGLKGNIPIVVGGGRSTGVYYLTPLIGEFSRAHPEYRVELHIMAAEDLVSAVEDGVVDLAASGGIRHLLGSSQGTRSELHFTSWFRGGWTLVTPGHRETDLPSQSVYVPDFAAFLVPAISEAVQAMTGQHAVIVTLASGDAVKGAVLHGLGAAVLPAAAVSLEAQVGLVRVQPLVLGNDTVMLFHRKPRLLTPGCRELLHHLVNARRRVSDLRPVFA